MVRYLEVRHRQGAIISGPRSPVETTGIHHLDGDLQLRTSEILDHSMNPSFPRSHLEVFQLEPRIEHVPLELLSTPV
jgi:hypothetical protein